MDILMYGKSFIASENLKYPFNGSQVVTESIMFNGLKDEILNLDSADDRRDVESFLRMQGLSLDQDVEFTLVIRDSGRIAATGSFSKRVLKSIAVDETYQNRGLSAKIVSRLIQEEYERNRTHLFIYTKPKNISIFSDLGFYAIYEVPLKVVLMENRASGIAKYVEKLSSKKYESKNTAAIVMNCNPFTLGHRYLIEYAAVRCDTLHLFVVWEDKSSFPAEVRYRLITEGVRDIPNVIVHKGEDYIISNATFPSYFIKEYQDQVETHARLDLGIFARYIAPALGISLRFVGEEPCCAVTSEYNKIMQEFLPGQGVQVEVVPRKLHNGQPISASRVRELIRMNKINEIEELVPESTYRFLTSPEAGEIVSAIQSSAQRH
jgi:[citrate (pro-3S)-lyase] ligase